MPAHPGDGELLLHQKSFGKHARGLATTIDDIEQQRAVAVGRIFGLQHFDIGRELDEPLGVGGGEFEVADEFVGGELGVEGKVGFGADAFVTSSDVFTLDDFHAGDGRVERGGQAQDP